MRPCLPALAAVVLAAGCATTDPGWRGTDATPFGTAEASCRDETASVAVADRDAAFEACMARHGWTRG